MNKSKRSGRTIQPKEEINPSKKTLILLCALTAIILLPFINKPFHLDDTLFVRLAEQIIEDPFAPYQFEYNWFLTPMPFWKVTQNPPLNSYILAIPGSLFGVSEIACHFTGILFAVGCCWMMYRIASRYTRYPEIPTFLTIASPGFLVSATNVMADVPLLFFWLLSVELTMSATKENQTGKLWFAGLSIAAASMTKYFGLALLPLLIIYWMVKTGKITIHLLAFFIPVLVIFTWGLYSEAFGGIFHPYGAAQYSVKGKSLTDLITYTSQTISFLGGSLLWPIFFIPILFRFSSKTIAFSFVTGVLSFFLGKEFWDWNINTGVHFGIMIFIGLVSLLPGIKFIYYHRNADNLLLLLWFAGTIVFSILLNWTINARILLIALFPLGLFFIQFIESRTKLERKKFIYSTAIITLFISMFIAWGDSQLALASRNFSQTYVRKNIQEGQTVYFSGHWGFQYYMEQEGAKPLDYARISLKKGDFVVYPTQNTNVRLIQMPGKRIDVKKYKAFFVGPFTLHMQAKAGFYSSIWGPVPYIFKSGEDYDIFKIDKFNEDSKTILNKPY
jgi:Dolichyl-phosphate-mannose-protein mannosyltransferase